MNGLRISKRGIAMAVAGAAGVTAYCAMMAHRSRLRRPITRGNPSSSAVALLFPSVPNQYTAEVCRWLHERGLSATFFLKGDIGRYSQGVARLRPFHVGITGGKDNAASRAKALETVRWLGERGTIYCLSQDPIKAGSDTATIPVAPSSVISLDGPEHEWKRELARLIRELEGGELILIKPPQKEGPVVPRLDELCSAISRHGLKIWGLKALLRGRHAQ